MFDFKDMALKVIHDIGGCDAADEWSRGYDAGVNAAIAEVEELAREDARIEFIANHYGFTSQANMLTEEAAEFTVALNKLRRSNTNAYNNIKEEVADVLVIALQLRVLLGPEKIDQIMNDKIERQLRRINEGASSDIQYINELTKEFWERKANEPPTDKCVDEAGWEEFGKKSSRREK